MSRYVRYIVVGSRKAIEHGYSTQLGSQNALSYAVDCAKHYTMQGRVFGETKDGGRELVFTYQEPISKQKESQLHTT